MGVKPCLTLTEEYRLRVREQGAGENIRSQEGVRGRWRKSYNEHLHDSYSPPNMITVIQSRGIGWAELVTRRERRNCIGGIDGKSLKERHHMEGVGVNRLREGVSGKFLWTRP